MRQGSGVSWWFLPLAAFFDELHDLRGAAQRDAAHLCLSLAPRQTEDGVRDYDVARAVSSVRDANFEEFVPCAMQVRYVVGVQEIHGGFSSKKGPVGPCGGC